MMVDMKQLAEAWNAQADAENQWDTLGLDEIVEFAVATELEACAKLCELHAVESQVIIDMTIDMSQHEVASLSCAAAIRARGE